MPQPSRLIVCLGLGAALLSALSGWDRLEDERWSGRLSGLAAGRLSPRLMRRQRELDARPAPLVERARRADEVAGEAAAGRLSLLDGAARLRDLYRAAPDFAWDRFREYLPAASDDERFCRLLIEHVRGLSRSDGDPAGAAAARLAAELQSRLARGALCLPDRAP
jgi:hypothetical protein